MTAQSSTAENTDERLPKGTVIDGRYEITGHLGRGGFAHVYKARHVHLDREIALKILEFPSGPGTQQFQARFLQEARIAAKIKHPNVVDVFDFGVANDLGQPYLAMDYLAGHDLEEELVRNGPMEPQRAVGLFIDTLSALGDGHRMGIVHKDLKPSNLYMRDPGTKDERLIILDFGIARVFGDKSSQMTQTGSFSGTPAYLAPEYIENQIVTPALDVYQMGLIMIETLTAIPAVMAGNSMAYLLAHCQGHVRMPEELKRTGLGEILVRATLLDPKKRYADATEFCDALKQVQVPTLPFVGSRTMPLGFGNRGRLDSINMLGETSDNTPTPPIAAETIFASSSVVSQASDAPTIHSPPASTRAPRLWLVVGVLLILGLVGGGVLHFGSLLEDSAESAAGTVESPKPVSQPEPLVANRPADALPIPVIETHDVGVGLQQAPMEMITPDKIGANASKVPDKVSVKASKAQVQRNGIAPDKTGDVEVQTTGVKSRVNETPVTVKTVKTAQPPVSSDEPPVPLVAP